MHTWGRGLQRPCTLAAAYHLSFTAHECRDACCLCLLTSVCLQLCHPHRQPLPAVVRPVSPSCLLQLSCISAASYWTHMCGACMCIAYASSPCTCRCHFQPNHIGHALHVANRRLSGQSSHTMPAMHIASAHNCPCRHVACTRLATQSQDCSSLACSCIPLVQMVMLWDVYRAGVQRHRNWMRGGFISVDRIMGMTKEEIKNHSAVSPSDPDDEYDPKVAIPPDVSQATSDGTVPAYNGDR